MLDPDLRTLGPAERGRRLTIFVDGEQLDAYEGESIAAALLAVGHRTTRWTSAPGNRAATSAAWVYATSAWSR